MSMYFDNLEIIEELLTHYRADDIRVLKKLYEHATLVGRKYNKVLVDNPLITRLLLYCLYKYGLKKPYGKLFTTRYEKDAKGNSKIIIDFSAVGLHTLMSLAFNVVFFPQTDIIDELVNLPALAMLYYANLARMRMLHTIDNPYVVDFIVKREILKDFVGEDREFLKYLTVYGVKVDSLLYDHPLMYLPYDYTLEYYDRKLNEEGVLNKYERSCDDKGITPEDTLSDAMLKLNYYFELMNKKLRKLKKKID